MPASPAALSAFVDDGDRVGLRQAVERSRVWLRRQPSDSSLVFGPRTVTAVEILAGLDLFDSWLAEDLTPVELAARLGEAFEPMASAGNAMGRGMLVTGYYEPVIAGRLRKRRGYEVPVYAPPGDLIPVSLEDFSDEWKGRRIAGLLRGRRLVPYPSRRQLRTGTGGTAPRAIAWARDRVDLFFVEVQGSGVLKLPDGREVGIGYAGSNGRRYRSIGGLLIDGGSSSARRCRCRPCAAIWPRTRRRSTASSTTTSRSSSSGSWTARRSTASAFR